PKTAADRGRAAHVPPSEVGAGVRRLQQDRPLVDAEIVRRYPAVRRVDRSGVELHAFVGEAGIEAVLKAVAIEQSTLPHQRLCARKDDLGCERKRTQRGRRCDGPVVAAVGLAHRTARAIAEKGPLLPPVWQLETAGPVAGTEAPDISRIAAPGHRIGDAISAVGVGLAPAVLEIIEAGLAHHRVADAAEVDPDLTVMVSERRREGGAPGRSLDGPGR